MFGLIVSVVVFVLLLLMNIFIYYAADRYGTLGGVLGKLGSLILVLMMCFLMNC
jgi:hypothetical protein